MKRKKKKFNVDMLDKVVKLTWTSNKYSKKGYAEKTVKGTVIKSGLFPIVKGEDGRHYRYYLSDSPKNSLIASLTDLETEKEYILGNNLKLELVKQKPRRKKKFVEQKEINVNDLKAAMDKVKLSNIVEFNETGNMFFCNIEALGIAIAEEAGFEVKYFNGKSTMFTLSFKDES